jgi:hypothetical protein
MQGKIAIFRGKSFEKLFSQEIPRNFPRKVIFRGKKMYKKSAPDEFVEKNRLKCCPNRFYSSLMHNVSREKELPKCFGPFYNFQKNCPKKAITQLAKIGPIWGQFFVHFFPGKISGKIPRKIFPQKCWEKMEFSAEKVLKNRFSKKFRGIFRGK